ncbi:MAG: RNA polymerase subunit sigma-70 [Pirellula sp.]|nr:RNA polymerase subunit sigma-70 [Pirellula sp.]
MNPTAGSITRLIPELRQRDERAILLLWKRYGMQIENLARPWLIGVSPGVGDAEDVAQSAFHAFCRAAAEGRATELADRDDLWRLLATISRHKATDRIRREMRVRRGGRAATSSQGLESAEGDEPSPADAALLRDELALLFEQIEANGDPTLHLVATMRLEGASNDEIAEQLGCTTRTVQRKLHLVERLWRQRTN